MRLGFANYLLVVLVCSLAVCFGFAPSANAVSNIAPDPNDYQGVAGGNQVRMLVSSGALDASRSIVYIYSKSPNPIVTVIGANHCYDGISIGNVDASQPDYTGAGVSDTSFTYFVRGTGTAAAQSFKDKVVHDSNAVNPNSACNAAKTVRTFSLGAAAKMPIASGLGDYYQIQLVVDLTIKANETNSFLVGVNSGIVSYTSASGYKFAIQSRPARDEHNKMNSNFYFATQCNASASQLKTDLSWFDADQGDYSQKPSNFYFRLLSRARGSSTPWSSAKVEISNYSNLGGNNVPGSLTFTFRTDKEYDWQWLGVSEYNGVQFQIPFDSAYAAVVCDTSGQNFALTPSTSRDKTEITPDTTNINVTSTVNNVGPTKSFYDEQWYLTKLTIPPGGSLSTKPGKQAPCSQFSGYTGPCDVIWKIDKTQFDKGIVHHTENNPVSGSTLRPGTKICYFTSVSKPSNSDLSWRHSTPVCATVVQIPYVQVLGNDLRVGSAFTGTNVTAGAKSLVFNNAASWVEYGILAPGSVLNIASESGANGGNSGTQSSWSKLTFANSGTPVSCSPRYGCFTSASNMGKIPSVSSSVKTAKYNGAALNYNKGSSSFSVSGIPSIISGANLSNFSQSASITTTGTITIDKDINYSSGSLHSANDIPQLILIANNINITGNVKHIDAWLIATGTINTCSDVAQTSLRSSNCSNQLDINGAIMASRLLLDRTYYNPSKPAEAAENLNLRGDSYIWASNIARQNGQWQTVYSTDLPPRY